MATATKKSRAAKQLARRAPEVHLPASMEFLVFEDNDGSYHWTIVAADGATLAGSCAFASHEDAVRAARHVRDGAASALFERHVVGPPADLTARRDAARDNSDAERWLDEGGSFSSEAVTRWPAPR